MTFDEIHEMFDKLLEGDSALRRDTVSKQAIREAIERADPVDRHMTYNPAARPESYVTSDKFKANLIKELGLDQ